MRIDAHHHLWDLSAVQYPWLMAKGEPRFFGDPAPIQRDYLIDEYRAEASALGVGASVHIQVGAADGLVEARWVRSVADANPDWPIAQVAFCDLTAPDLGARLDELQSLPTLRGVRQIVGRAPGEDAASRTNALLETNEFAEGLRELARRNLSFDLQLVPELIEAASLVLENTPETRVALCHAGSPHDRSQRGLDDWAKQLRRLSDLPQVVCKLSGLGMFEHDWTIETVRPIVETCFEQFGANRCMFGSNFPVDSLYTNLSTIVEAYEAIIPERDWADVFGRSAEDFFGLSLEGMSALDKRQSGRSAEAS